jgi:uncharacterized protein (TIGR02118 family)
MAKPDEPRNDDLEPADIRREEAAEDRGAHLSRRNLIAGTSMAAASAVAATHALGAARAEGGATKPSITIGPVKRIQLAHPRAGISLQEFDDHWRHPHATLVRGMHSNRHYVQHHRISSDVFKDSDSTYRAIAEVWQDSVAAADASKDPQFVDHVEPDEPNFVDQSKHIITIVTEEVVQATRREVDPDASFGDLSWFDRDAGLYITLTQFIRDRSVDFTRDESLELARRLSTFRHVINRSINSNSEMAIIRQFIWPTLTIFEQAVQADRASFNALRRVPSSFLYLARTERIY